MGNGAKAAHRRAQQDKNAGKKGNTSQLKVNSAACTVICQVCRSTFMQTVRQPELQRHAESKHNKQLKDCFPSFVSA